MDNPGGETRGPEGAAPDLPDALWREAAAFMGKLVTPGDLLLAPPEFLGVFPETIGQHVRRRMLPGRVISHYVLHKGMLDRVDPLFIDEAAGVTPVFANQVFVAFSRRGQRLPDRQGIHLAPFVEYHRRMQVPSRASLRTGVVVTTYNRPWALRRTLVSLAHQRRPVVVVDDGSSRLNAVRNRLLCRRYGFIYVGYPLNMGLANAINIGVGHWLAHAEIDLIATFNDDVELAPGALDTWEAIIGTAPFPSVGAIYSGSADPHHPTFGEMSIGGHRVLLSRSASARGLCAHRDYWQCVLPVPTTYLGAPKAAAGLFPGQGSDEDWWIASWAPDAAPKRGGHVVVVPGLVETFARGAATSTWANPG